MTFYCTILHTIHAHTQISIAKGSLQTGCPQIDFSRERKKRSCLHFIAGAGGPRALTTAFVSWRIHWIHLLREASGKPTASVEAPQTTPDCHWIHLLREASEAHPSPSPSPPPSLTSPSSVTYPLPAPQKHHHHPPPSSHPLHFCISLFFFMVLTIVCM